uniref:Uncharacterized protein n=1 Tax=Meloidogyne enterolobii TaxID=390850 RepID=A0A6V7UTN3_MELEN|nr:unnamed protein product [Meloidogyne enterolobii]
MPFSKFFHKQIFKKKHEGLKEVAEFLQLLQFCATINHVYKNNETARKKYIKFCKDNVMKNANKILKDFKIKIKSAVKAKFKKNKKKDDWNKNDRKKEKKNDDDYYFYIETSDDESDKGDKGESSHGGEYSNYEGESDNEDFIPSIFNEASSSATSLSSDLQQLFSAFHNSIEQSTTFEIAPSIQQMDCTGCFGGNGSNSPKLAQEVNSKCCEGSSCFGCCASDSNKSMAQNEECKCGDCSSCIGSCDNIDCGKIISDMCSGVGNALYYLCCCCVFEAVLEGGCSGCDD